MRADLFKVIVERPRLGGGYCRGVRADLRDLEDGGSNHESMYAAHRDRKSLNENLRPLERFLRSKVGQHWNRVYSEISQQLSPRNAVQQHVRDHLKDYVSVDTSLVDGEVLVRDRWRGPTRLDESTCWFYVHPGSGVLLENRRRMNYKAARREHTERERLEAAQRRREVAPGVQLHRLR